MISQASITASLWLLLVYYIINCLTIGTQQRTEIVKLCVCHLYVFGASIGFKYFETKDGLYIYIYGNDVPVIN